MDINPYLTDILRQMFICVGVNEEGFKKAVDSGLFRQEDWYLTYEWTIEKQNEFETWLVNYLYNNKTAREAICQHPYKNKRHLKEVAKEFTFLHGWKLSE